MKTLYVKGDSLMHRLSPRTKLSLLAIISLLLFLIRPPAPLAVAMLAAWVATAISGISVGELWQRLKFILVTIVVVTIFGLFFGEVQAAVATFFRMSALALFAIAVTATTSTSEFIDVVTDATWPFEKTGLVRASDLGLAIGLVIRFIPETLSIYQDIRDAHYARQLKPGPVTIAVPLIIMTLRNAIDIAAAIDARGMSARSQTKRY